MIKNVIVCLLEANHMLCAACLIVATLLVGLPFTLIEALLHDALRFVQRDVRD